MTNKERQLIIDSIHHWEKDVITYLENDDTFYFDPYDSYLEWKKSGDKVLINSKHCPLCRKYLKKFYGSNNHFCLGCLWLKHYRCKCYDEEYSYFAYEPNLFTGKAVVNKLWSIGLQDHSNKHFVSDYKYYSYNY